MPVWVKICGITHVDDARAAWEAGADAIGLNFVAGPRRITAAQASPVLEARPPDRTAVALVELGPDGLEKGLADFLWAAGERHLQTYGEASLQYLAELATNGWQPIAVCRAGPGQLAASLAPWLGSPKPSLFAILLDSHHATRQGGTGAALDWNEVAAVRREFPEAAYSRFILAGGLNPINVRRAIEQVQPWGVDVSSGVESELGRKDPQAVSAFIRAARAAV